MRGALKRRGLRCGVTEKASTGNKNKRILAAFEPPLRSGYLHAHVSVIERVGDQMRDWNPALTDQPDDYLDAAAGAILAEPVRIGRVVSDAQQLVMGGWRPDGGVYEAELDLSESMWFKG